MIQVVAKFIIRKDKRDEALALLKGAIAPTLQDKGQIEYLLHEDLDHPGTFFFLEKWEDREALSRHLSTEHMKAFMAAIEPTLAEPITVNVLHKI